jgi:transcriptional regulator with XRE-family HTH domain
MEIDASFGAWLRRRRKALDLTQEALAERVGCSPATIRKIEGDERRPSRQIAEILADVLEIATGDRAQFLRSARGEQRVERLIAIAFTTAWAEGRAMSIEQAIAYALADQVGS